MSQAWASARPMSVRWGTLPWGGDADERQRVY